jgi:hypothetical protein
MFDFLLPSPMPSPSPSPPMGKFGSDFRFFPSLCRRLSRSAKPSMLIDKNGRDARKDKIVSERVRREEEQERGSGKREDREEKGERDGKEGRLDRGTERQR